MWSHFPFSLVRFLFPQPLQEGATLEEMKELNELSDKRNRLSALPASTVVKAEIEAVFASVHKLRNRVRRRRRKKATAECRVQEKRVTMHCDMVG